MIILASGRKLPHTFYYLARFATLIHLHERYQQSMVFVDYTDWVGFNLGKFFHPHQKIAALLFGCGGRIVANLHYLVAGVEIGSSKGNRRPFCRIY